MRLIGVDQIYLYFLEPFKSWVSDDDIRRKQLNLKEQHRSLRKMAATYELNCDAGTKCITNRPSQNESR